VVTTCGGQGHPLRRLPSSGASFWSSATPRQQPGQWAYPDTREYAGPRAEKDPEFAQARKDLYTRALAEAEALTRSVMATAHARYHEPPPEPEEREAGKNVYVTIQDRRADHGRLVVEATERSRLTARSWRVRGSGTRAARDSDHDGTARVRGADAGGR